MASSIRTLLQRGNRQPYLLLILLLVLRFALTFPIMTYQGWLDHEADYYNTARTLVNQKRLPTAADFPDQGGVMLQATQPPLFYAILVPMVALFDRPEAVPSPAQPPVVCFGWSAVNPLLTNNPLLSDAGYYASALQSPATARTLMRALNVLMTCASLVLVYATARQFVQGRIAPLLAAALLGFEPNTLYVTTIISNDALLLLIVTFYLYIVVRTAKQRSPSIHGWIGIGLSTIAAILTRLNGWVLLPVTVLAALTAFRFGYWTALPVQMRRRLLIGIVLLLMTLGVIILVNMVTMGSLVGRYRGLDDVLGSTIPKLLSLNSGSTVLASVLHDTAVNSYLASVSFIAHPRLVDAFGWFSFLTLGLGLGSGVVLAWRVNRRCTILVAATLLAACLLVFTRNLGALDVTTSYSTTLIFAPLRYYLPGLAAAAILISIGLARFRVFQALGLLLVLIWVAVNVLSPSLRTVTPQPSLLSPMQASTMPLTETRIADSEAFPQFRMTQFEIDQSNQLINLHLVTGTEQHLALNYALRLEFVDPQGKTTGCQFPVANGQYPTLWWQVGDLVETQVKIPNCTRELPSGTHMSLRWVADKIQSEAIPLGQLDKPLARSTSCPPFLGSIADSLLILNYNAPLINHISDVYLPSVNWYVQASTLAYTRTYIFTHIDSGVEYVCDSLPRLNTYPFSEWKPGETIYFDECALHLPANAPLGLYRVSVSARDQAGNVLTAANQEGQITSDSRVEVATIEFVR